jgi:hypothetical protein
MKDISQWTIRNLVQEKRKKGEKEPPVVLDISIKLEFLTKMPNAVAKSRNSGIPGFEVRRNSKIFYFYQNSF